MHGLILAGGEGSRLAADGIRDPKPLVSIGGRPQLLRLCETLEALGCEDVTCMVRRGVPTDVVVRSGTRRVAIPCKTPSSLHTLALGLEAVPAGPVLCTMVDTVMPWESWVTVRDAWQAVRDLDGALLVVTPAPARDPNPLRVEVDAAGWVSGIGAGAGDARLATAGVYLFGAAARARAPEALARGIERMRGFLAFLPGSGVRLRAVEVPRAVDLDRREDLEEANTWAPTVTP